MVVGFYVDTYFVWLWVNKNPQYPICDNFMTEFVVIVFWLSYIVGVKATNRYFYLYSKFLLCDIVSFC